MGRCRIRWRIREVEMLLDCIVSGAREVDHGHTQTAAASAVEMTSEVALEVAHFWGGSDIPHQRGMTDSQCGSVSDIVTYISYEA